MKKLKRIVCMLMMMFTVVFSGCVTTAPQPEVTKGRFDFSVTYEVHGEEKTYSGTYVCEYQGMHVTLVGEGRDWKGYIEDGNEMQIPIETNDLGVIYMDLGFYPEYFMADPDYEGDLEPEIILYLLYHSDDPDEFSIDRESDFLEVYGVRVLSFTYAKPIENNYKKQLGCARFVPSIN